MGSIKAILSSMRDESRKSNYKELTCIINKEYNDRVVECVSLRRTFSFLDEQIQTTLISIFERDMFGDYPLLLYVFFFKIVKHTLSY